MKVIGSIMMYSGMQNPERELSENETKHILELLSTIDQHYNEEWYTKLGFSGYCVEWRHEESDAMYSSEHPVYFQAFPHMKTIGIYKNMFMSGINMYKDTSGLCEYLKEILNSLCPGHDYEEVL